MIRHDIFVQRFHSLIFLFWIRNEVQDGYDDDEATNNITVIVLSLFLFYFILFHLFYFTFLFMFLLLFLYYYFCDFSVYHTEELERAQESNLQAFCQPLELTDLIVVSELLIFGSKNAYLIGQLSLEV